jgi:hypothetical protein
MLCTEGQPPYYSLASPAYETLAPSHMIHHTDPLGKPQLDRKCYRDSVTRQILYFFCGF